MNDRQIKLEVEMKTEKTSEIYLFGTRQDGPHRFATHYRGFMYSKIGEKQLLAGLAFMN
jgi:hypothetical protein